MIVSRNIDDLRPDVAKACRRVIEIARREGLPVLITSTGRDREYQEKLYAKGRTEFGMIVTNAKVPSFHNIKPDGALAFDFCKNVKHEEYCDRKFFERVGEIGESLGLEWAGRWTGFKEMCHLQWAGYNKEYSSRDIIEGRRPPELVLKEEEKLEKVYNWTIACPKWAQPTVQKLLDKGYLKGDENGQLGLTDTMIKLLVINDRAGLYD